MWTLELLKIVKVDFFSCVQLNPITLGGGGGGGRGFFFGTDHHIIDHNSETALSITSKLSDF